MNPDTQDLERRIRRLRRRLVFERALFSIALLAALTALVYPRLFPSACTSVVCGRPLIAVAERAPAQRVLQSVARGQSGGGGGSEGARERGSERATEQGKATTSPPHHLTTPRSLAPSLPRSLAPSPLAFTPPVKLLR